ncbi:hypothetical protein JTE90_029039 [Oedothorax gibbosus]|uniref:Chaperone DnaJ C-terminal domain-containing protein n=1 Tax=Oedothorax gibbosus TaxID=931172 RepID=A0AAV6UXB1_9ARAC|nr:hypothetical protein JTE90_029039 [Oedothorax gibbosus]
MSGPNMSPGNVILRAEILPDSAFRLEGQDMVLTQTVSLSEALLGCTVGVTTFDGKRIHLQVTEVIQPKYRIPIKGEGMPIIGLGCKSDLIVEFDVIFPEKINSRQRKLLEETFNVKTN